MKKKSYKAVLGVMAIFFAAVPLTGTMQAEAVLTVCAEESSEENSFAGVYQAAVRTEQSGEYVSHEYPVLTGIENFNQNILDMVNQHFYNEAVRLVQEEAQNVETSRESALEYNPEAADSILSEVVCGGIYLDGDIFSVRQDYYSYMGGAHGYSYPFGTTFDLRTGEVLTMGGILGCDEETAQKAVVEAYRRDVIESPNNLEHISEDTIWGAFDMMEYWKDETGMHVNIAPYGIASYAAGQQTALVTQEILEYVQGNAAGTDGEVDGVADTEDDSVAGTPSADSTGTAGDGMQEMITVVNGIQAPASDFIFPYSSERLLTDEDLVKLQAETVEERHYLSQLAINEILARYGYVFHEEQGGAAKEAYDQFEGLEWYEQAKPYCPSASANDMLYTYITDTELENVDIICEWQKVNGCYY